MKTWVERLSGQAFDRGMVGVSVTPLIVAILTAWSEDKSEKDARKLLNSFSQRLSGSELGDALLAAKEWIEDPSLSAAEWAFMEDALRLLQQQGRGPVDWNAEFAASLMPDLRHGMSLLSPLVARALHRAIDLPLRSSVACLYSPSAALAWAMAEEHDVTLFADHELAIMVALIARAAGRPIKVSRRNPLDGTFMPGPFLYESPRHTPPFEVFEHIVAVPPFGGRVEDGPSKGLPWEAAVLQRMPQRASRTFTALLPDGVLFRETRAETELRRSLADDFSLTVMSLPPGMYGPRTSISTSLVRLERSRPRQVRMIDARTMGKSSSGRVQEKLIVQHLDDFRALRPYDMDRTRVITHDDLAANGFSLLPERYLKSGKLSVIERILEQRPVVSLSEVADVERGKAPQPIRDFDETPPLSAMEIAPMDLAEGFVRTPTKQQGFDRKEEGRLRAVTVEGDDILVSIKGNVGNVGLASAQADLARITGEPWIISQSLAIVRLKRGNPYIPTAEMLHALLTAPWVREKLESMSGATTVRTLPISALRNLMLPVPTPEEREFATQMLEKIEARRTQVARLREDLDADQNYLWEQLWQLPAIAGVE